MLQATLVVQQRVLGSSHPQTGFTVQNLHSVRSKMHTEARSNVRRKGQTSIVVPPSPTQLAEAEARARAAEAELMAMLDLDDREAGKKGKSNGKAKKG